MTAIIERFSPQSKKAAKDAKQVRDRYDEAFHAQSYERLQYNIVRSYMGGDQWLYLSRQRNTIENMQRDPSRVRITDNRIASNSRTIYAKMLRRPLVFDVSPSASDDAVTRAARLTESVISDTARRQRWEQTLRRPALSALWEGGTAVASVDWDSKAGTPLGIGQHGPTATGDVACAISTIAEAFCEPGTTDMESAWWWIRAQALPAQDAQFRYGLDSKPATDVSASFTPSARGAIGSSGGERPVPLTLVLTYYERPNPGEKDGKWCVVIGDDIVEEGAWPFPFTDHLNCVVMRETFVAHKWMGDSIVYQAISLQNAINANVSSIVEHSKLAGNARLLLPENLMHLYEELTDTPGEALPFSTIDGKPEYMSPPALASWLVNLADRLDGRLDNLLGVHDVSRGNAPANIESGVGLSILAENDETPIGFLAKEMGEGFGKVASMCAALYEKNATEGRSARVAYDEGVVAKVRWTGKDLMGQTDVVVPLEAIIPRSREAARARAMEMLKLGAIKTLDEFELIADISPRDRITVQVEPAKAKARRENHHLSRGVPLMPADFDDHAVHIDQHNRFRMTETYELLDEDERSIVDDHVQAHENLAAEDAAKKLGQNAISPALAAAPEANQGAPLPGPMPGIPMGPPPDDAMPPQLGGGAEVR